jgi:hypothetical protein
MGESTMGRSGFKSVPFQKDSESIAIIPLGHYNGDIYKKGIENHEKAHAGTIPEKEKRRKKD